MIKLSKKQVEIEGLADKVPQLTSTQIQWAIKRYTYFQWVRTTDTDVRCPNCKEHVSFELKHKKGYSQMESEFVCPHCGAKINVREYDSKKPKRNHLQEDFFEVLNVVGDWQVTRLFYMQRYCYTRKQSTDWRFYECCQAWNTPKDKNTYFRALPKKFMPTWCYNPYSLWSWNYEQNPDTWGVTAYRSELNALSPRKTNGSNYFSTNNFAPNMRVLPYYKQRGLTTEFLRANVRYNAMSWFQYFGEKDCKPMYETLIKAKEYKLLEKISLHWSKNTEDVYFSAWKIAQRNHYHIKDASEWVDLIDMLRENNMDWRSPHYICPADFKKAHQELVELTNRKRERERRIAQEKRDREYAEKCKAIVEERIRLWGDFLIDNGTFHSVVMITYDDYTTEGKTMHHCVGGYFSRKDSLILSMRDKDGKRVETVEVNLTMFKIIQSQGVCNNPTPHHEEIMNLVNSNMEQIKKRYRMAS